MSTDPQTTERGKNTVTSSYWTLAIGGSWNIRIDPAEAKMVFVKINTMADEDTENEDVATAMRDPANVLNVAAYPGVVEAAKAVLFMPSPLTDEYHELTDGELKRLLALEIALSDVHPEAAKAGASNAK